MSLEFDLDGQRPVEITRGAVARGLPVVLPVEIALAVHIHGQIVRRFVRVVLVQWQCHSCTGLQG